MSGSPLDRVLKLNFSEERDQTLNSWPETFSQLESQILNILALSALRQQSEDVTTSSTLTTVQTLSNGSLD